MLDVFKFPACINSSCWYTVSLKVVILATGTFDIFRISVKYILIQTRRISYSAFYKKLSWVIICSFQKVRLPYTTLGMLVSPQDTAVLWQSDHNRAGTLWLPSTKKKPDHRSKYNHSTVSRLHGEKMSRRIRMLG